MTKDKLANYDGKLLCKTCGHYVNKTGVYHKSVFADFSITKCKVCGWIERHGIPKYKDITDKQFIEVMHYIIYEGDVALNHVAEMCNITLDEAVELWDLMCKKGLKMSVEVECANCGTKFKVTPGVYKQSENNFCSSKCYHEYQAEHTPKGEDSPFYNRIKTHCDNCGKEIEVIPHDYNTVNQYNDNHNFCSQECYWEFRGKYYVGDKSNITKYHPTEEQKQEQLAKLLMKAHSPSRLDTSIQKKINEVLDSLDIKYEREYPVKFYSLDNYLTDTGLIIEVMGDYWHSNPIRYNKDKYMLNEIQSRTIIKDKQKSTYISNHLCVKILYLWETDINKNIELCTHLIQKYLDNNGVLDNYHSFNWHISDNDIKLNSSIIIPYQDQSIDKYRHLIKA